MDPKCVGDLVSIVWVLDGDSQCPSQQFVKTVRKSVITFQQNCEFKVSGLRFSVKTNK